MTTKVRPKKPIRRFDVFAEYQKLEAQADGMPADQAKGYALWVAKVVAARKFGRSSSEPQSADDAAEKRRQRRRKWKVLSGVRQTDKRFAHEVVERMGGEFYRDVFAPAVRSAREHGHPYEAIRDRIRRSWKPVQPAANS